jgi:hypothetical protein
MSDVVAAEADRANAEYEIPTAVEVGSFVELTRGASGPNFDWIGGWE